MKYDAQMKGSLEATGLGSVEVAPDLAEVRLAVITEATTAAEATAKNAEVLQQVIDAVEALPNRRVSTVGLSLRPIYDSDRESITGYRAENRIEVEAAVDDAAAIFDAGVAAGANISSGIGFRLQDEGPHREQALALAYEQAHADATTLAGAAGVQLLGPEEIVADPGPGPRSFELDRLAAVSTPVLPGPLTVSATVRVRFGILRQP